MELDYKLGAKLVKNLDYKRCRIVVTKAGNGYVISEEHVAEYLNDQGNRRNTTKTNRNVYGTIEGLTAHFKESVNDLHENEDSYFGD